jgi:hypothetical protein
MKSLISIVFLYRGEGYPDVTVNVGASTAHKIVKIDYIALQCKSLINKKELNRDRVGRKGTQRSWSLAWNLRTVGSLELLLSKEKKVRKHLTNVKKYAIVLPV